MTTSALETLVLYLVILLGVAFTIFGAARSRRTALRPILAYEAVGPAADEAVETDKALHISLGGAAVRDESTLAALAGAEILYFAAQRAAVGDRPTLASVSDPVTLAVAQDSLRRAFKVRGKARQFRPHFARWYPQGQLSLAFAAGVSTTMADEDILANILIGRFGAELALIAETAIRRDQQVIAQSDRLEGQAVAYAFSRNPLIGEELYAGAGYLNETRLNRGGIAAMDILRYLLIVSILVYAALTFISAGTP